MARMANFWQDLRHAVRALRKSPAFTGAAILLLALGIGANSAVFSVVHAVLLDPVPYRDPGRLVQIERRGGGSLSIPEFQFVRDTSSSYASVAASADTSDR